VAVCPRDKAAHNISAWHMPVSVCWPFRKVGLLGKRLDLLAPSASKKRSYSHLHHGRAGLCPVVLQFSHLAAERTPGRDSCGV
jgi:hypothetical protein